MAIEWMPASVLAAVGLVVLSAVVVLVWRSLVRRNDHAAHAQLQRVLDNLVEGVMVMNDRRQVLFYNQAATALLTAPAPLRHFDPTQADTYSLLFPDGRPMPREQWPGQRALRGDFAVDVPVVLRHRDTGALSMREVSTYPFSVPRSSERWVMLTVRDETTRQGLEEARNRLAFLVESSDDAIIGKDTSGIITSWNKGAERIFGYTAEEMIGQSILRLLPPERQDEEQEILHRILRDETVHHYNTTRITKDGRTIHVSLSISPIKDSTGQIVGASKIARDMTGLRNLEEQLRRSQKMDALGQLTGGIAHDFNNLLGILLGNLELLESEIEAHARTPEETLEKMTRALERIHMVRGAATRAADLTRRLLAFSCNSPLQPVPTQVQASVLNTLAMAVRALGPNIEVTTHLDETLPPLYIDPGALEGALLNLIVNARDAMPEGGVLSVNARRLSGDEVGSQGEAGQLSAEDYVCISVTDNGTGMTEETMQQAFDPFFTTKPRGQGTGLGLAIVYGFAKQCNGTVRIHSRPSYGTTVSLYLPLTAMPVPVEVPLPPQTEATTKATHTILLVDDEPNLLEMASTFLQRLGYRTVKAQDAITALEVVDRTPELDVVLTDIIMPGGMDGFDLAHRVRAQRPEIGIVYTSGFPADALAKRRFTSASDVLLQKPYRLPELGEAIYAACKARHTTVARVADLPPVEPLPSSAAG